MKFSIIIPVYNVAPYLRECLDSIVAQTFTDWEAICVDDGSVDGSGAILNEYAVRDGRFNVVHKRNEGVSVARNAAIELATGDYIGFVDADDAIAVDWLFHANECIGATNADVVRFEMQRWRGECGEAPAWCDGWRTLEDKQSLYKWGWAKYLSGECGGPCNIFARRQLVWLCGKFPLGMRMKEDRIFLLRLLMKTHKMVCSDYQGYFYRERCDGACGSKRKVSDVLRYMDEVKWLAAEFRQAVVDAGAFTSFCRAITWTLVNDIEELMEQGDMNEWRANREMPKRLLAFWKDGLLKVRYVRPRYVPALICVLTFGSMKGFVANRKVGLLKRVIRRRVNG